MLKRERTEYAIFNISNTSKYQNNICKHYFLNIQSIRFLIHDKCDYIDNIYRWWSFLTTKKIWWICTISQLGNLKTGIGTNRGRASLSVFQEFANEPHSVSQTPSCCALLTTLHFVSNHICMRIQPSKLQIPMGVTGCVWIVST